MHLCFVVLFFLNHWMRRFHWCPGFFKKRSSASDLLPPSFLPHVSPLPLSLLPSIVSLLFWSPLWVAPGPRLASLPCVLKRMFFPGLNCLSWPPPPTPDPFKAVCSWWIPASLSGLEWKERKSFQFLKSHGSKTNLYLKCVSKLYVKSEKFEGKRNLARLLFTLTHKQTHQWLTIFAEKVP